MAKPDLNQPNVDALAKGIVNLDAHIENIRKFGLPVVVAINAFPTDTAEEMAFIEQHCKEMGVRVALSEVFAKGGEGGKALAQQVLDVLAEGQSDYHPIYELDQPLTDKIRAIATTIYGAKDINILPAAAKELANIEAMGYGSLPICMAKTQYSPSDDASPARPLRSFHHHRPHRSPVGWRRIRGLRDRRYHDHARPAQETCCGEYRR